MQIKAATGKPNRFKTEALIVSHYENDTDLTAEAAAVDGAQHFGWDRTAAQTLQVYRSVLATAELVAGQRGA